MTQFDAEGFPLDWEVRKLGEVADCRLGKMLDKNKNVGEPRPYLRNTNVQWGRFDLDDVKEMRISDDEVDRYSVRSGDLLVCEGGEPGRCAVWRGTDVMYIQKALHRVRPGPEVSPDFLRYFMELAARSGWLEPYFTGVAIKHLPGVKLAQVSIPLPSIAEQENIASEIERHWLALSSAEADLEAAEARIDAFGIQSLKRLLYLQAAELPPGWDRAELKDIASLSSGGTPSRRKSSYFGDGYPWVKIGDLNEATVSSTEESITQDGLDHSAARLLEPGAVMLAMYGASIGRTGVLDVTAATNQAICSMVPDSNLILADFLLLLLQASKPSFVAAGYGGAQPNISQRFLRSFVVPLPPLVEQHALSMKGREIQSSTRNLRATFGRARSQSEALRVSVLARGFRVSRRYRGRTTGGRR